MCVDSAVRPDDLQGPPVGLWPCHQQGGNQVFSLLPAIFFLLSLLENAKQKSSLSVMHSCKVYIYFWWSFRFKENWIFIWIFYCFWRFHRTLFKLGLAFISAAKCCWWWWFLFYWFPSLNFIVFGKLSSRTLITFIHLYDFFIFWNWICLHLLGKKFA